MKCFGVVMAGGGGTRFWPLSRQSLPKQMLNLTGNDLMINEAVDRLNRMVHKEDIFIVTSALQAEAIAQATDERVQRDHILAEPSARNTAACIGYAAIEILEKYGDGVMIITPSDHYIQDVDALTRTFEKAVEAAEKENKLVTIGIKPTFPSTGFGYIKQKANDAIPVKEVLEFKEKPDAETAQKYIASGEYVWNSGMFVWKASVILEQFQKHIPDIYEDIRKIGAALNTPEEQGTIQSVYSDIRRISVDYAILEPASRLGDVLVVAGDFPWSDIGSWDMMDQLHEPDQNNNILIGDTLALQTKGCVCYSTKKLIATYDVENLVVVETDDAILVCSRESVQQVREIVLKLEEAGRSELL